MIGKSQVFSMRLKFVRVFGQIYANTGSGGHMGLNGKISANAQFELKYVEM